MGRLNIRYVNQAVLKPDPANARFHSDQQIWKIATSIAGLALTTRS